jgi:hypothetical protein
MFVITMTRKVIIPILLLVAIFTPLLATPKTTGQGVSFTVVTANTPPPYQCTLLPLEFTAQRGQLMWGYFTADVTMDIYILSQNDFNTFVQTNTCTLPGSAYPLFMQTQVVGSNNAYTATIPTEGTYYLLFVYRNNGISQITSGYATIDVSYPLYITLTQVSPTAITTSTNTAIPEFPVWGTTIPLILAIFLAAAMIRRKSNSNAPD